MPEHPWRVASGVLFGRLDRFLARVGELDGAFQAAAQFQRLERIEIGSTKARPSPGSGVPACHASAKLLNIV